MFDMFVGIWIGTGVLVAIASAGPPFLPSVPPFMGRTPVCRCNARLPAIGATIFAVSASVSQPMIINNNGGCTKTITCTTTRRGFIPSVFPGSVVQALITGGPFLCHATTSNLGDSCTATLTCDERGQWTANTCQVNLFTEACIPDGRMRVVNEATCL